MLRITIHEIVAIVVVTCLMAPIGLADLLRSCSCGHGHVEAAHATANCGCPHHRDDEAPARDCHGEEGREGAMCSLSPSHPVPDGIAAALDSLSRPAVLVSASALASPVDERDRRAVTDPAPPRDLGSRPPTPPPRQLDLLV